MIPAETIAELALIGLSAEQARAVASMLRAVEVATQAEGLAALESRRAADRNRKALQRERDSHVKSRDVTGQIVTSGTVLQVVPLARAFSMGEEVSIDTPEKATLSSPKGEKQKPKTAAFELESVIGSELAAEVVDHRKRMRRPLTAGGAKRLAQKFLTVADPQAAARMMIDRGWQGFEAEWVDNVRARAGPHAPNGIVNHSNSQGRSNGKAQTPSDFLRSVIESRRDAAAEKPRDLLTR